MITWSQLAGVGRLFCLSLFWQKASAIATATTGPMPGLEPTAIEGLVPTATTDGPALFAMTRPLDPGCSIQHTTLEKTCSPCAQPTRDGSTQRPTSQ